MPNDTTLTQAAAQRCADLANAVNKTSVYRVDSFYEGNGYSGQIAFRRYVETEDAMKREVLRLFGLATKAGDEEAKAILRENLLPEPTPTLLELFEKEQMWATGKLNESERKLVGHALDWIAKRQENEG